MQEKAAASGQSARRFGIGAVIGLLGGLLLGTALIAYYGVAAVGGALLTVGWRGFLVVVAFHAVVLVMCGIAWWLVVPPAARAAPWVFISGRFIRDACSEVLPLSQIGGYVMGARATVSQGLSGTTATASTVVDVTMELVAQLVYTMLGVVLLVWLRPDATLARPVAIGIVVAIVVAAGFILAQQRGFTLLERMAARLAPQWLGRALGSAAAIRDGIHAIYRHRIGLLLGFLVHLLCWITSGIEVWVALYFLQAPLSIPAVLVIESLLYAIRSVAFVVPNAAGVQEGAYVMLGALFGLSPDVALALSLLKRGRDLLLGVPSLLLWQAFEGRRLLPKSLSPAIASDTEGEPGRSP
jgi:glycosyltransferase 2 family protein